jgi:hypothetical protein
LGELSLLLDGHRDEASRVVTKKLEELGTRTDPAATRYREFARRFAAA